MKMHNFRLTDVKGHQPIQVDVIQDDDNKLW